MDQIERELRKATADLEARRDATMDMKLRRDLLVREAHEQGWTLRQIGEAINVSPEGVRQILMSTVSTLVDTEGPVL